MLKSTEVSGMRGRIGVSALVVAALLAGLSGCYRQRRQDDAIETLKDASADAMWRDPQLRPAALELGARVFAKDCASCHGADLKGLPAQHTPDLTDAHWLHGGDDIDAFVIHPADVEKTILHGIHTSDPLSRNLAEMPVRGVGHELDAQEIGDVADYVLKLSHQPFDGARAVRGRAVYEGEGGCFDCHTVDGIGDAAIGAVDLTLPKTWLYGRDRAAIIDTVTRGRRGVSPAFAGKIAPVEIRAASVFVLSKAASAAF
jgi:cytochrome c oxidase cbb3-type subunit 3